MKRILTILLIVMMVFSITGCDPDGRAKMADFMGKMGQNVMGTDTSGVDKVVDLVQVDKTDIKKPTVGGEPVKVSENITIKTEKAEGAEDKVVTKVTVGEVEVKVDQEVKSVLPPLSDTKKTELVEEIGKTIKSEEKKEAFVSKMSVEEKDPEVIEATAGSAVVMKAAIEQTVNKIEVPDTATPEQKKQVEELKSAISGLTENLEKIGNQTESVSKADVVTIQLVQNFVENVSKADIQPGNVPAEVLTDASNLLTVTSALSSASKFNAMNVLDSLTVIGPGKSKTLTRNGLTRAPEESKGDNVIMVPPEGQEYINVVYKALSQILDGDFKTNKSNLAFHAKSYENYVNMLATKVDLTFAIKEPAKESEKGTAKPSYDDVGNYMHTDEYEQFNTFEGVLQYAAAAAISEADDVYQVMKDLLDKGVNVQYEARDESGKVTATGWKEVQIDTSDIAANVGELFNEFVVCNPWVKKEASSADVELVIPEKYRELITTTDDLELISRIALGVATGRDYSLKANLVPDKKQYGRTAMETFNKAVVFTGVGDMAEKLGDIDLHYEIYSMIQQAYVKPVMFEESVPPATDGTTTK